MRSDRDARLRILVSDGEARAALAVTRCLGAVGFEVHVVSRDGASAAGASRHAASDHAVGDPDDASGRWSEAVRARADAVGADFILPITEASLGNVYKDGLASDPRTVCPSASVYAECVDKHALMQRAEKLGIDVPRSVLVEDPARLAAPPSELGWPLVLKPRRSRFLVAGRWQAAEVRIAHDDAEWQHWRRDPGLAGGCLVQEFVPGHGEAVFLLCSHGETRARFAHRRLREKPPGGGQSVLRESIAPDPELLRWSEALLADLGFHGVAMVEFRRAPDGRAVLMEINPRLWGSLQLAIDAGVDFPVLMLQLHLGHPVPVVEARLGVRTRWLLGDLDHLLICLRRPAVRRRIGLGPAALIAGFLRSFFDGTRTEIWRFDDRRPFYRELRAWLREG